MDSRTQRHIDYDLFMDTFVKAGLTKSTDEGKLTELLEEVRPIIDGMDFDSITKEPQMYPHLCKLFNAVIDFVSRHDTDQDKGVVHHLRAMITSQHGQGESNHDTKVDLSFYDMSRTPYATLVRKPQPQDAIEGSTQNEPSEAPHTGTSDNVSKSGQQTSNTPIQASTPSESSPHPEPEVPPPSEENTAEPSHEENIVARCMYDFIRMFVEVKLDIDAYRFPKRSSVDRFPEDTRAQGGRGQIAEYAGEILERQHRLFTHSLYIYKDEFAIQIFDRNGMIMSTFKNYKRDPMALVCFLYYFVQMSDEQVGYDPTVVMMEADSPEVQEMKAKITDESFKDLPAHVQDLVKKAMKVVLTPGNFAKGEVQTPIYKVAVPQDHGIESTSNPDCTRLKHCLIGRPHSTSGAAPVGRGTKGFVAFDTDKKVFVFLKDAWRERSSNAESATYDKLRENNVRNVATLLYGGDLPGQCTRTHEYLVDFKQPMYHHRLVLREIGRPLEDYETSQQLCGLVWQALIAHSDAWERAQILHRDISQNNIIISIKQDTSGRKLATGLLIDWDLAKSLDQLNEGTWAFLSAARLTYPGKPWEVADDLESFVHLVNWNALRYHQHNIRRDQMATHIYDRYQSCKFNAQIKAWTGCHQKVIDVSTGSPGFVLKRDPRTRRKTRLAILIDDLMDLCQQHFESLDEEALAQYQVPDSQPLETVLSKEDTTAVNAEPKERIQLSIPESMEPMILEPENLSPLAIEKPESPFGTHEAILATFRRAFNSQGWPALSDKTSIDQCKLRTRQAEVNISSRAGSFASSYIPSPATSSNHRRGKSSSKRRGTSTRTGSKRKAANDFHPVIEDDDVDTEVPESVQGSSVDGDRGGEGEIAPHPNPKRSRRK
ncbi:hypothetical protein K474DRAFT_818883 [Panus rudis PR-1116 ss-1]|nr:hypothetical protein K474DRAFT_818883 [Panus rudis PR-1116 ss-1]